MDRDIYRRQSQIRVPAKPRCSPPNKDEASKRPGAVKGAPNGAAKRTLDGEDHFETINEGENSATISGAEVGLVNWDYRDPLHDTVNTDFAAPTHAAF